MDCLIVVPFIQIYILVLTFVLWHFFLSIFSLELWLWRLMCPTRLFLPPGREQGGWGTQFVRSRLRPGRQPQPVTLLKKNRDGGGRFLFVLACGLVATHSQSTLLIGRHCRQKLPLTAQQRTSTLVAGVLYPNSRLFWPPRTTWNVCTARPSCAYFLPQYFCLFW